MVVQLGEGVFAAPGKQHLLAFCSHNQLAITLGHSFIYNIKLSAAYVCLSLKKIHTIIIQSGQNLQGLITVIYFVLSIAILLFLRLDNGNCICYSSHCSCTLAKWGGGGHCPLPCLRSSLPTPLFCELLTAIGFSYSA